MFEQDIQLAQLLLEKHKASMQQRDELLGELSEREHELEEKNNLRQSREGYADIMAKAAALLDRPDLQIDTPDTSDLEHHVNELRDRANAASQQTTQFEDLLRELEERAPDIVATARGEQPAPEEEEETPEEDDDESRPVDNEELQSEEEPNESDSPDEQLVENTEEQIEPIEDKSDDESVADETTEPAFEQREEAVEEELDDAESYDPGNLLKRFNLHSLKTKEAFTYGRGAAYIIDASSVLQRVPNYDLTIRGGEESTIRDELLRDFDQLSRELSGTFYVVFDSWYHPLVTIGNRVAAIYTTGDSEGTIEGAHRRIKDLVKEIMGKHRSLCVVTSADILANDLRDEELFIISLADFFNF